MNYYQLDDSVGMTTPATFEYIWFGVMFMMITVKPQYYKDITIHICGKKAHVALT